MVRWYGETVAVRPAADDEPEAGEVTGAPAMFLWRERVYVVREVLGHWRERRSWWAAAATGEGAYSEATAPVVECEVWRLEAGAGGLGRGVFDLCREPPVQAAPENWRLLRSLD